MRTIAKNAVFLVFLSSCLLGQSTQNTTIQPDCIIPFTFTAAGNFPATPTNNGPGDNRQKGCAAWTLMYQNSGMTSVSVTLQSGASVNTTVTFGSFAGTVSAGFANPIVSDTGGSLQAKNGTADISWVRVNVAATGAGTLNGILYGFRNTSAAVNGGSDPCTTTALSLQYNNAGAFGCISNWTSNGSNVFLTAIAAPATPAAGKGVLYEDSTSKNFAIKDDAGTVKHGVQTKVAVANNFATAIDDAGVVTVAQPSCSNLVETTCNNSVFTGSTATNPAFSATPTFSLADVSVKSPVRVEPGAMTANVTAVTFTNKTAGAKFSIAWTQDGTGGRTVTYGASATNACTVNPTASITTTQYFEVGADGSTVYGTGCVDNSNDILRGPESAAPGTPPTSTAVCWFDSTNHIFSCKENNSATVASLLVPATCTNQFVRSTSAAGVITCASIAAADLPTTYKTISCQPGLGDGLNAIAAGTYLQTECLNEFGATWTITAIKCFTDNNGSSTLNVSNGSGTGLLTGAVTCTNSFASGTQSGTTTIASGDYTKFTFVADGTTKQATFVVTGTR